MVDREKVIANVTGIVSDMQEEVDEWKDYSDSELSHGLTCDCDWWYKTLQTLKDALALLKEQEPRVMTLEEAQSCENAMWIELLGGKLNGKGFYAFVLDRMKNGILEISTRAAYLRYYSKDYNVKWRCWTGCPDQATREATPWE